VLTVERKGNSSGSQPFTLKSMLVVLLLVAGVTGVNIVTSPPRETPEPEPEYEYFFDYDFAFAQVKGTNFSAVGLDGENATDDNGRLMTNKEDGEQPLEDITIVWGRSSPDPSLEDALELALEELSDADVSVVLGLLNASTMGDHDLLSRDYNRSDPDVGELTGVLGAWYCNETRRQFTLNLACPMESTTHGELMTRYEDLMESFRCHFSGRSSPRPRVGIYGVSDLSTISLMVFLCLGFTFTYMMDGFLNFAHVSYASIGGMVHNYLTWFWGFDTYDTWPFAALVGGLIGMFLYVGLVRPIGSRAKPYSRDITLTFAFWVVSILLNSTSVLYSYWTRIGVKIYAREFRPTGSYFNWNGIPSTVLLGIIYSVLLIIGLHLIFKKTHFGLSLRATAENEDLASVLGVDRFRAHLAMWFISGALSAVAGAIFGIGRSTSSDLLLISVMTGSILGGLDNIYGAIFGGMFIAIGQKTLHIILLRLVGVVVNNWYSLIPIVFLWLVLVISPNGITGIKMNVRDIIDKLNFRIKQAKR